MAEITSIFPTAPGIRASNITDLPDVAGKPLRIPMRPVKIGIGVSLLLAGVYGIFSDRRYVSTDSAVVTAYVTEVRAPVDGVLSGLPSSAGVSFRMGALVGAVDNAGFDSPQLDNLNIREHEASNGADAARLEQVVLEGERRELLSRAEIDLRAVSARLEGQRAEAERLLAARTADVDEAKRELDRGAQLHDAGILADSQFESLQSKSAVALAEQAAQQHAVATIDAELRASSAGVLSESGATNDVPYSRQRADEVKIKMAEVEAGWAVLHAQTGQAQSELETANARLLPMRHSDLLAPVTGLLWKLDATNGERVATGDPVARVVECDQAFVLAEVPQDRVPEIAIGAPTSLRLSGETEDRFGKVLSISGDPQRDDNRKLAAFPNQNPRQQLATVRISMERSAPDENGQQPCLVGRAARVRINVKDGNLFARLWRRYL